MPTTSALLRSASANRKKVLAYQDAVKAYEWQTSLKTYDQYRDYASYLEQRSKSTTDASSALSLRKTADSAYKGYISNEIQRASIAVTQGTGNLYDKYNKLAGFFQQAQDLGQYDLAQSLIVQMGTVQNTIISQEEAAQAASERLAAANEAYAKKNASAQAASNISVVNSLKNGLDALTLAYNRGGQLEYNKAAKKFVDSNKDTLKALGIKLPEDYSTNIGQVIEGTIKGIGTYYTLAADAVANTDPEKSADYLSKAQDIALGNTTFKTPAGNLSYAQAGQFAKNPSGYIETVNNEGQRELKRSTIAQYVVENGKIVPKYTGTLNEQQATESQQKKALEKLGFKDAKYDSGTGKWTVQLNTAQGSEGRQDWFKAADIGTSDNGYITLEPTDTGFQFYDQGNNRLYQIGFDNRGLAGLYNIDPIQGIQHISGQYGFNQNKNSIVSATSKILDAATIQAQSNRALQLSREATAKQPAARNISLFQTTQQRMKAADPLNILGRLNSGAGKPGMVQRAGGGYNFTDAKGNPISALTYANLTGQSFRNVLSSMRGDSFAAEALRYAGNDGAYNPATVSSGVAKNWNSLIWGNNVKLQTPQVFRVNGTKTAPQPIGALRYF